MTREPVSDPAPVTALPPGVTSFDVPRVTTSRPAARGAVGLAVAVGLLTGLSPAVLGADPVEVLLALGAAVVLCLAGYPLPGLVRLLALVVAGIVGLAVIGGPEGDGVGELVSWLMGFWVGVALLLPLLARRDRRRRLATAAGAPAVDHDPRGGTDVGTLATWRDARHEYEAVEPDPAVVLDAVRRLGSAQHVYVSVYRGRGRMDVIGRSDGYVVQQTDNRLLPAWDVNVVVDPASLPRGAVGELVRGGFPGSKVDRARVVGLAQAESAVRTWLTHGTRDRGLSWKHLGRSDAHPQPTELRRTD